LILALAAAGSARAQQSARRDPPVRGEASPAPPPAGLSVSLPSMSEIASAGPLIRTTNVIADKELRKLVESGFPAALHYRAELWSRGGLFDDLESATEWNVTVRYEPLTKTYRVARFYAGGRAENLGRFERYEDAELAVARTYQPGLPARRTRDKQYYIVALDLEVMSMSDLDELEGWLRGELRPAVRGKRNPGTALGRGISKLATRLLGGEKRRYEQRTETFRVDVGNRK
jgi:hypothetical protein